MDFNTLSHLGTYISKDYSADIFRLLIKYEDISSSEAASRLNIHIKTAQDFLEALSDSNILDKNLISDKKRPYYRYSLKSNSLEIKVDLNELLEEDKNDINNAKLGLREKNNSGARFTTDRYESFFSSVRIPVGEGRLRSERKINLTRTQGLFLFNLPFPGAKASTIDELLASSGLSKEQLPEISDIIELLIKENIIETLIRK